MLRIKALALENSIQRSEPQLSMLVRYKTINENSKEKNEQRETILEAIDAVKDSIEAFEDDQWREQALSFNSNLANSEASVNKSD